MSAQPALDYEPSAQVTSSPVVTVPTPLHRHLEVEFRALATHWHKETRYWSSISRMSMHPAYQRIIALGDDVIPLILRDLKQTRSHWLWALYVLSGFYDPSPENASFDEAV